MVGTLLALVACAGAQAPPNSALLPGSCEPSAVVPWGDGWLVGDNETSTHLFAYGPDFARRADVPLPVEVQDIEALAVGATGLVVVGSHSRNKRGEVRPGRERVLVLEGTPRLLALALDACPGCEAARALAPDLGGFNVEGAVVLDERLVLGLRGPLSAGKAQLLEVSLATGATLRARAVDLGGEAFRELTPWKSGFLAVSGPVGDPTPGAEVNHHLWWFASLDAAPTRLDVRLPVSTEAIYPLSSTEVLYLVDGDGKAERCATPGTFGRTPVALP